MSGLVLSLFPGIGLLDMAFEEEGFCVVRGPDLLWGGDIKRFHPPAGKFDGVIGGPPCKGESRLAFLNGTPSASMRDDYCRVVHEADPAWWIMEAVVAHQDFMHRPVCIASMQLDVSRGHKPGCICERRHGPVYIHSLNNRWLGEEQNRLRYFHSNLPLYRHTQTEIFNTKPFKYAVLAGHGGPIGRVVNRMIKYPWDEACRLQGLPVGFDLPGFTTSAKREAIGNGVPLAMGRAVAKAVKHAVEQKDHAA